MEKTDQQHSSDIGEAAMLRSTGVVVALAALIGALSSTGAVARPMWRDPTSPPLLPEVFTSAFNEKMSYLVYTFKVQGVLYYDWDAQSERIDRSSGEGDRYCGTAHPFKKTPCTHLVTQSKRYLIFPDRKECCFCCDSEHGCGVLRRDFLANATFDGYETVDGTRLQKWSEKGLQPNYYWVTDAEDVPVRLLQKPNDDMNFVTFSSAPIDPSVFQVADSCDAQCSGTCSLVQPENHPYHHESKVLLM